MKNHRLKFVLQWMILLIGIGLLNGITAGKAAGQYKKEMTVAKDGSGDYRSIQDAVDASKSFPYERITIHIKNGVYREKVKVHAWNTRLTFVGESKEKTIITYDDYFDKIDRGRNSTFFTYTLLIQGNDFEARNLTVQNTAGSVGQAVALHVEADRAMFENCRFLGNQDTIYLAGEGCASTFRIRILKGPRILFLARLQRCLKTVPSTVNPILMGRQLLHLKTSRLDLYSRIAS